MDFANKVVIVTGSSSGIGAATAQHFASLSAKVVIVGRNVERLNSVAKTVEKAKGIKPLVIQAEMTNDADVKKVVDETVKTFGRIDVLVNNHSIVLLAKFEDGIEPFDKAITTNVRSIYLLTSLATPHLIKSKGNIVNMSSITAMNYYHDVPYYISKAAIEMFTRCIAKELAVHGIRVNAVKPGIVKTNFGEPLGMSEDEFNSFINSAAARNPLGRVCTSEEIAEVIVFLASDKAKSVTGSIYSIDNGENLL